MKQIGKKVSYVKNPLAKNSYFSLGLGLVSLILAAAAMYLSVSTAGNGALNTGAYGLSSILMAFMGVWFGILSFQEKERNYILAKIGVGISLVLVIFWGVIIVTGFIR